MRGDKPQASQIIYAMTSMEATSSSNLIIGCCVIASVSLCVLYDSRATHSFVLESWIQELGLLIRELQYDLHVSTLTSRLVKMFVVCARCSIFVEERKCNVNLICLPLQGLDVILGMDW